MSTKSSFRKNNLILAFTICLISYIIALAAAYGIVIGLKSLIHPILVVFVADIGATLVIYIFSMFFKNSSLYDPYWSVAPLPIVIYWFISFGALNPFTIRQIVVSVLITLWAIRLTHNWARGWGGLGHEDWRYVNFRTNNPKMFWLINLTGIQLMPTVLVFLGCLSIYPIVLSNSTNFGVFDIIGAIITSTGILMEFFGDEQLRKFNKKKQKGEIIASGLWKYSRHPNYFGEISFWWGLYFFALAANPGFWWTIVGPVSITILFFFISIPMIEKNLIKKYPNYVGYQQKVSMLVPWFSKK